MKYVSEKYEKTLSDLAEALRRPIGSKAILSVVETPPLPWSKHGLKLCEPIEHGFEREPGYTPPEVA